MKQIYTLCHSFEEANDIGHYIMSKGYVGVQNDSYRYCEDHIRWALEDNHRHHRDYCFVGVNGCCMVVGKNKKEMRSKLSMKYIEKERVFRDLLTNKYEEFLRMKNVTIRHIQIKHGRLTEEDRPKEVGGGLGMSKTIEELASKYVEDVYGGDTDFIYETEDVLSWLFNKPLAQRLTELEKEMIIKEYENTYPNDPDNSISNIAIASVLKRIFGKDFFENNNHEEDNV